MGISMNNICKLTDFKGDYTYQQLNLFPFYEIELFYPFLALFTLTISFQKLLVCAK